jgi:hypothetical protein
MQKIYQLNVSPTPERTVHFEDCSNGVNDSNYNKTEVIDPVSDEEDLGIDMHGWDTQSHPGPSSQEQNPRYFTRGQRSRASSSCPQQLPLTSPPPNHGRVRGAQHSRSLADRQPNTIPKTLYSGNFKNAPLFKSYDKRTDPMYNAIRDPQHGIHRGCDFALPSVEGAYARRERTELRARRRYTKRGYKLAGLGCEGRGSLCKS